MSQDTPQLSVVPAGPPPRQRYKHRTIAQRADYIEDLRFILDANSYKSRQRVQALMGQLVFTGKKEHGPTGKLLRMILNHHKLDAKGRDFRYPERFNLDGQYVTSRPKLIADYRKTWHTDLTNWQVRVALEVLENEGILSRRKAPIGPGKWAIYIWLNTRQLNKLLEHPEEAGKKQKLLVCNAKAAARNRGGRMAENRQHYSYRGVEVLAFPAPVPFAADAADGTKCQSQTSSTSDIPVHDGIACGDSSKHSGPSARGTSVPQSRAFTESPEGQQARLRREGWQERKEENPKPRGYEPAVAEILQMAETKEIFCHPEGPRVARPLTQEERDALAGCVRTMGLTPAWLKSYQGAIEGHLDHYVTENAETTWWLHLTPELFARKFWVVRRELEKAQVLAALEERRLELLPITDNTGWNQMVADRLDDMMEQCTRRLNNPQQLESYLLSAAMGEDRQPLAIVAVKTIPELAHLADRVLALWRKPARQYLLSQPRTLVALSEGLPVVEWFGLPETAVERAKEWLEQAVARYQAEGSDLQRRLAKCHDY